MKQGKLPEQQRAVCDFIERYHAERGIAPSVKDVADSLQVGVTTARTYIEILKAKGCVASTEGIRRSLRTTGAAEKTETAQEAEQCR